MSTVDLSGWVPYQDVKGLCQGCTWVLNERSLSSCEYGDREFPSAHKCPHFKAEDDE